MFLLAEPTRRDRSRAWTGRRLFENIGEPQLPRELEPAADFV
jgi:hypothetical protein